MIIIISVIISLFGKNKKKVLNQSSPSSKPVNPPQNDLPKDLTDLFDFGKYEAEQKEKNEEYTTEEYETIEAQKEEEIIDTVETTTKPLTIEADYNELINKYIENPVDKFSFEGERAILDNDLTNIEDDSENVIKNKINNESFDLQKAIIFSEILNRKYN
jgi:hypothetical protein